jgi:outer membrane protein OmpA-like peptidoglycan-associated protein
VVAQAVHDEPSASRWPAVLAIAALALGLFWLFSHLHRPVSQVTSLATGTANRVVTGLGDFIRIRLPNNVDLNIPERGVETRLIAFIRNPVAQVAETSCFDFDRLHFDTATATLRPESQEQLNSIAAILSAFPNVRIKVGGYTDNIGDANQNLRLSQDRANMVVAELVRRNVSPDRLIAQGYGEQYAIADNSTEEGRAQNRRVSMCVTQK